MLAARPPFWRPDHLPFLDQITYQLGKMKAEHFSMSYSTWDSITAEGKDFIKSLLKADPEKRLPIEEVQQHGWFQQTKKDREGKVDDSQKREVLFNLEQFKNNSVFFSMCVTSAARQIDPSSISHVHQVFVDMDTNGDGRLSLEEVKAEFAKQFGEGSPEALQVEEMFSKLDLDGSGTIDYTEFLAAGMGEQMRTQKHVLHAAFRAFDIKDDDGAITKDEIVQVLRKADVQKALSEEVCQKVAQEIMDKFDIDNSGTITFDEWLKMMAPQPRIVKLLWTLSIGRKAAKFIRCRARRAVIKKYLRLGMPVEVKNTFVHMQSANSDMAPPLKKAITALARMQSFGWGHL